jgi:hypothetical protein
MIERPNAPANPAVAPWLQFSRPVGRIAELGTFGHTIATAPDNSCFYDANLGLEVKTSTFLVQSHGSGPLMK